jgi:hypothetical protein
MIGSIAYESSPHLVWAPLSGDAATVFYEGAIVSTVKANQDHTQDGLLLMGAAAGAGDLTATRNPFGIIQGFSDYPGNEIFTGGRHTMTAVASSSQHAATTKYLGGNTNHGSPNDGRPWAQVALINPSTYIKMPIFNGAFGTAITVGAVTAGGVSTTGAGFTSSACCDVAGVAGLSTVYCRSGANRGVYRITSDTSTTVKTVYDYFRYDIAAGDTFVGVPMRLGTSYVQLDATSTYLEASATPASNYYEVNVVELNLETPGEEYAIFRFNTLQFYVIRPT